MSQQIINIGTAPNDGLGDPIRTAFTKTNTNFTQLFAYPNPTPPSTLVGSAGDIPGMYAYSSTYFYYCFGTYDGSSVIWAQVSSAANVTGTSINNGNSNVSIDNAGGNVNIGIRGSANIATFTTSGVSLQGNVHSNNILASNYFYSNGAPFVPGTSYGNANVDAYLPTYTGNIGANTSTGYVFGNGSQLTGVVATDLGNSVSITGNIQAGAVLTDNYLYANGQPFSGGGGFSGNTISITGNVQANNFIGNGFASFSKGVSAGLNITTSGNISASGNIYGSYIFGSFVANATYSNIANVVSNAAQPNITSVGNTLTVGTVSINGTTGVVNTTTVNANTINAVSLIGTLTTASQPDITSVGTLTSLNVAGSIQAGTVTSGNVSVSGIVSTSGNITTAGNLIVSNAIVTASTLSAAGNIVTASNLSATGDIVTANNLSVSGSSLLNGAVTLNGNVTSLGNLSISGDIKSLSTISAQGNVLTQGVVSAAGDVITDGLFIGNFQGNVTGNLVVNGANTQVLINDNGNANAVAGFTYNKDSNTLAVLGIVTAQGNVYGGNVLTSGLVSVAGNIISGNVSTTGNVTGGNLKTSGSITAVGTITGAVVSATSTVYAAWVVGAVSAVGNSSQLLMNIGGNIAPTSGITYTTGAGGNLTVQGNMSLTSGHFWANNITGNITTRIQANISTVGNVLYVGTGGGGTLHSNIVNAVSVTGTLTTAAQHNITSVGTLTSLSVAGEISAGQLAGNGVGITNINGSNISNTVPFANVALYSGTVTTNAQPNITSVGTLSSLSVTGNVHGSYYFGNGSQLSGISTWFSSNTAPTSPPEGAFWYNTDTNVKYQYYYDGTSHAWVDQSYPTTFSSLAVSGNATVAGNLTLTSGALTATSILNGNANGTGNIGNASTTFNTVFARATSAQYADLAEIYSADNAYEPGTVVVFGGGAEITVSSTSHDTRAAGIISTQPAHLMNAGAAGLEVALTGRVPCRVVGIIRKGDRLVNSDIAGVATVLDPKLYEPGCIIGKALEEYDSTSVGVIEVSVGRY